MRSIAAVVLSAAAVQAHYVYNALIQDGKAGGEWANVRMTDNHYSNAPVTDISLPTLRCYQSVVNTTGITTATVQAGQTVGFVSVPATYHPGPLSFYMARLPDNETFDNYDTGTAPLWFKIFEDAPAITANSITWPNTGKSALTVSIPKCLPSGNYLLRIEQIGLHTASAVGGAQFYISCAQIAVTGGGSTTPTAYVSLPGAYQPTDPGLVVNIYYPIPQSYTVPGPRPFSCAG